MKSLCTLITLCVVLWSQVVVFAELNNEIGSDDFTGAVFDKIDDNHVQSVPFEIASIVESLGAEYVGADSKIDLGIHDGSTENISELEAVSKNSTVDPFQYPEGVVSSEKEALTHTKIEPSSDLADTILETLSSTAEETSSSTTPAVTDAFPVDSTNLQPLPTLITTSEAESQKLIVEEVTTTQEVHPVQRPTVVNREVTSTTTRTHTVSYHLSHPVETSTSTSIVEIIETFVVPNPTHSSQIVPSSSLDFLTSETDSQETTPALPEVDTLRDQHQATQISHPTRHQISPSSTSVQEPLHDHLLAPDAPSSPATMTSEQVPFQLNTIENQSIEVQIENAIKDKIENYLKQRFEGLYGSSTQIHSTTLTSDETFVTSVPPVPKPTDTVYERPEPLASDLQQLKFLLEAELGDGFEDLNIDRLKDVISAVLNLKPDDDIPSFTTQPSPSGITATTQEAKENIPTSLPNDEPLVDRTKTETNPTEMNMFDEILSALDTVNVAGLSDKESQKLKKSKYNLSKLKEVPEGLLEDLLYFYFSKDKRQSIDDFLQRPYLEKVALDITRAKEEETQPKELNDIDEDISSKSSNNTEATDFDKIELENDEGGLKAANSHIDRLKGYKKLDEKTKVSFEFDREKQRIGLKEDMRKGKNFKGKFSNPEKELFGKLSVDGDEISLEEDILDDERQANSTTSTTDPLKQHSSSNSAGVTPDKESSNRQESLSKYKRPANPSKASSGSTSKNTGSPSRGSFLDKIKKNPSLLFQDDDINGDENDFDFTKSEATGLTHTHKTPALIGAVIVLAWSIILI